MARLKRQPKKGGSAHPGIARFIQQLQDVEQHELPSLLAPLLQSGWQWPRTDMQHWIHPLNRFDDILETVIRDYDLGSMEHLQTNEFTPRTKELVLSVLAFQKLLLENSTNRKIFNGFDRINDLLHTTDITVLLATLRLALRPAQQYSSYNSSLSSIPFSEKRLLSLAQPWGTREHGIDLMKIAQDGQLEVPLELQEPEWQFYRKVDKASTDAAAASDDKPKPANEMEVETAEPAASTSATVSTPAPPRRTASFAPHLQTPSRETAPSGSALLPATPSTPAAGTTTSSDKPQEGLTTLHLPNLRTSTKSTVDILLDSIEAHQVPEADRLDLLQRIRIGKALCSSEPSERQRLLIVRLLALSVFAHAQSEQSAQLKVFLYEPDIIAQIAELVHPEKDVPVEIKSVALYALEAFARYKGKTAEVASALNASVSHGVLMELVRKTAADLDTAEPESTAEFIDALFNVLTYINVHQAIGQMVIGAGIVNVLLDFVKISSRGHLQMVAANKAIVILDGFLYGYTNAFTAFIAANGLDAFIGRVKSEVDSAVEEHREEAEKLEVTVTENSTGLLSFQQGSVLKSILRAIHRLMTTSGTTEGLRNLIDTSLLASVKKVMENRFIFGPQVFALVTNIAATFVHNEPTSLTTLQEAKVPDALYDSLERAIPASNDVLQAVPNAIGAFCLNQAGLDHFLARNLIAKYFVIFTSPAHYELLRDRDSAVNLGSAIDELVRHHPTLKAKILDTIFSIFVEFKRMGAEYVPPASESGYNLQPTAPADATTTTTSAAAGTSEDVAMQEGAAQGNEEEQATKDKKKAEEEKTKDNEVTNAIDVFGRFLEGLFQNVGHTQDFIEHKGKAFDLLLDLLELPCSPAIMLKNGGYSSIVALFRISSEIKAAEALTAILGRTDKWLNETKWFWEPMQSDDGDRKSTLAAMIHPSADEFEAQQKRFRDLTILLSHVSLLSDVFTNLGYAHGKAATAIISVFTVKGPQAEILQQIGQVYRACLWENVTIRPTSFWSGEASKAATEQLAKDAPEGEAPTPAVAVARERQQAQAADVAAREVISTPATPDSPNIKLVQDVVQSFTRMTLPLYQIIVKLLVHRRSPDAAHRKVARAVAQQIAGFMRDTLAWPNAHDLPANLAYSAQSLILVTKLHLDERPNGLQTLLLRQFVLAGGLDAYVALFKKLLEVSSEYFASAGDDASAASPMIIPVFGALKTALDFLGRITTQKTIFEASQTALLISRESDPTSPDYFDAPAFLVRLRHDSLPVLRSAWEQPWLRKCPQNVIRSLVSTLINIIKADGEAPSEAPARPERILGQVLGDANLGAAGGILNALGAVFGGGGGGGGGAAAILGGPGGAAADARAPIGQAGVPDEQRISQLIDMGFPRSASETALRRCRNSVAMATEFLLQHPDLVGAAREEEARRLLDPAPADDANAAAGPSDGQANAAEAQPAADQPAPATEEAAPAEAAPAEAAPVEAAQPAADVAMEDATPAAAAAPASTEVEMVPAAQEAAGPSIDEMRANLKAARSDLAPTFVSRTLELAEEYGDLVFDVKAVFGQIGADENDRNAGAAFTALLDDLRTLASAQGGEKDAACAARLRLIALLATDAAFRDTVDPLRTEIMAVAMLFNAKYSTLSPAKDARPIWLAPFMLVADAMLSLSGVPTTTTILPETEEVPSAAAIERGPAWTEEKKALFETALDLLEKGVSTRDVFISTLRLLLFLTRNAGCALSFVERGGLRLLLSTFSVEAPETKNCHSYAVMIMRHLVEDKALLKPMMEREIEAWFGGTRSKVADASGFVRGVGAIAARDLETFLEAAQTTVKLVQADAPAHYHVTLQRDPAANAKDVDHEPLKSPLNQDTAGETADVGMTDTAALQKAGGKPGLTPAPSTTETVVHFLMQQALDLVKPALAPILAAPPVSESPAADKKEAQDSREGATEQAQKKDNKDAHISPDVPLGDFYQSAFSLASLAELVASYNSCKTSFFTFSTRKGASKEAVAPRSRSSFLFFLLNELVPTSCLVPSTDFDSKRIASMWGWASLVIVGLCYDATAASVGNAGDKDLAHDITFVRKAVLDALARAFRDAMNSNEPMEARYSRLASLSDLCHRLLTARPFPSVGRPHSETSMLLAKLMLEKNFAVILTNALADVDLNFPHVNNLINAILRPLENLTKIATKLGRAKNSATGSGATKKREVLDEYTTEDSSMLSGDESDSNDSASDDDDEAQEQAAADLYRHSALGMYEGELEQGHPEEFMSADEEDFDDDDEMMEEMDDFDGSDISDASDDEDDDDEDDEHGAQRQEFSDADMEELADDDEADLDTDEAGSAINESDVEEEILIEGEEGGDLVDGLDALEGEFDEEEGDWIDAEDEEGLAGGGGADGDQLLFDEGGPIRDGDEEDDIDDGGDSDGGFTDEEEVLTGELEFDPEMTEQLRAQSTAQAYGWDPVTGGDGSGNRRNRGTAEDMLLSDAMFDRPQVPPRTAPDHPLLTESAAAERADAPARRPRGNGATSRESAAYQEWVRSVETMLGPGGVDTLQEVLGAQGLGHLSGPDQLRIQLAPGPNGGMAVVIDPSPGLRAGHVAHHAHHEHRGPVSGAPAQQSARSVARQLSDRINAASAFLPMQTSQRWHEEREIFQGCYLVSERAARLTNHLINALHPAARAEAKVEKAKTEEKRKKEEQEAAERKKKQEEEEAAKKAVEAEKKKKEEEEEEATRQASRQAEVKPAVASMEVDSTSPATDDVPDDIAEVMNLARSLAAGLAVPAVSEAPSRQATPAVPPAEAASDRSAAQTAPPSQAAAPSEASGSGSGPPAAAEEAPAPAQERVTVLVHGEEVDITDTGIDREFLEALPDDMRDEVISQHFRENRIRSTGPPPAVASSISSEFLDALPPALRAEVMRNEAEDQRRQQEAAASGGARAPPAEAEDEPEPAEEDIPRDFLAALDPQLRSAVLGEGAAGGLLGGLLGAAGPDRHRYARRTGAPVGPGGGFDSGRRALGGPSGAAPESSTAKKPAQQREVIQLLDKSGLATLVRLLFFPHPLKRGLLQKVLVNLCENTRTRIELVNLLLTILQDGTRDVSAVDKSFSQMSLRASRALAPKDTPKRKVSETPGNVLPHLPGESVPNLIAQRCLDALIFLVAANEQTPLYFLTEQELPMSRRAAKKGKGKEKAAPTMTYPIVVLLGLLERPGLLKTPAMMEAVMSLLASISRSLQVLQKKAGSSAADAPAVATATGADATTSASSAAADASASASVPAADSSSAPTPASDKGKQKEPAASDSKDATDLTKNPPKIPPASLRLVVNVLDAGECSSRTFSSTLSLIQNLSNLPGARDTILDELKLRAEKISNEIVPHLVELLDTINRDEPVGGAVLGNFTPASSSQAKLLRILKTIDFFGTPPKKTAGGPAGKPASQPLSPDEEQIKTIYSSLATSDLWKRLGDALGGIEAKPDLLYLSTVLLPLIESLLVVNKFTDASSTEFIDFTTAHSKILNTMVRNNPSLMSGSFAVLVRNSSMLDFENKRSFFFSRLHDRSQRARPHYPTINLNVRRARVFEDSYHVFLRKTGDEIKYGKLNVKFYDEEGVDAGGVTREWFGVLARQMFNPGYALFQPQAADSLTYQPNKASAINEYHLEYFRFVGRIIGKAIHDQRLLEAYFSRAVYKHMLGKPVDHRDLESIDPEYYKSLVWMLDNDIDGIIDLTFSVERDEFGVTEVVDLIPNGRNIPVTNENKHDYVRRIADQRLSIEIKDQMDALLRGLYEIVPKDLLQIFSERELELLISGLPEVEVEDWQANTNLVNFSHSDPVIRYFWRAVRSFSHQERVALLQFVTGSSRVPLDGFKGLQGMHGTTKFSIHKATGTDGLPSAHTCFNQLDLPQYDSYEKLRRQLLYAITEGSTGFALA